MNARVLALVASSLVGCCFGLPSAAVCDEACAREGTCRARTEHAGDGIYRCYAGDDDECRGSEACRASGRCAASEDGLCVRADELDAHRCARSVECRVHGACHSREGFCDAEREEDCRSSLQCRTQGRCELDGHTCVVGSTDCAGTTGCELEGLCTSSTSRGRALLGMGATCALTEGGSCADTLACRLDGRCAVRPLEGCTAPCQVFYCGRAERATAALPCVETQGSAHLVCEPDGRCMSIDDGACEHVPDGATASSTTPPAPLAPTSPMPSPTAPSGPPFTVTHPHAILSFAISRDGLVLATGSECGPDGDYESPEVGVVLWDVPLGTARAVVPVEGGVGLGDQLRRGLAFSDDGSALGFDHFTNLVGVLDTRTAQIRLRAVASGDDAAPGFALDARGEHVFIDASEECTTPSLGSIYASATGRLDRCVPAGSLGRVRALAWRGSALHVIAGDALATIDSASGALVRRTPFFPGGGRPSVWPSPRGRRIAAAVRDGAGVTLLDADTHARIYASPEGRSISGFVFDRAESRWAAVSAERSRGAPVGGAAIFEDGRAIGTIAGPLAPMDWQRFADGVPFAFSPDGRSAIALRPTGDLERWTLARAPQRDRVLANVGGANAVLWATDDVVVALGPRVLAFLRAADGTTIARYDFPP